VRKKCAMKFPMLRIMMTAFDTVTKLFISEHMGNQTNDLYVLSHRKNINY